MGQIDFDGSNSTVKADIIRGQTGTTVKLGGVLDTDGNYIQTEKGGDLTSASPLVIDTDGDYFDVTGTTNFAAMTVAADRQFTLQFDGVLTMTHHATNLDLPGEANITTAAGDVATFQSTGSNTVQCISYVKADGTAVAAGGGGNKSIILPMFHNDSSIFTNHGDNFAAVRFEDGVTDGASAASWTIPDDFTSFTSIEFIWVAGTTGGEVARLMFTSIASTGAEVTAAGGDTDTIAEASYTDNTSAWGRNEEDISAVVDGVTLTAGHELSIGIARIGGSGSDTMGADIRGLFVKIVYA